MSATQHTKHLKSFVDSSSLCRDGFLFLASPMQAAVSRDVGLLTNINAWNLSLTPALMGAIPGPVPSSLRVLFESLLEQGVVLLFLELSVGENTNKGGFGRVGVLCHSEDEVAMLLSAGSFRDTQPPKRMTGVLGVEFPLSSWDHFQVLLGMWCSEVPMLFSPHFVSIRDALSFQTTIQIALSQSTPPLKFCCELLSRDLDLASKQAKKRVEDSNDVRRVLSVSQRQVQSFLDLDLFSLDKPLKTVGRVVIDPSHRPRVSVDVSVLKNHSNRAVLEDRLLRRAWMWSRLSSRSHADVTLNSHGLETVSLVPTGWFEVPEFFHIGLTEESSHFQALSCVLSPQEAVNLAAFERILFDNVRNATSVLPDSHPVGTLRRYWAVQNNGRSLWLLSSLPHEALWRASGLVAAHDMSCYVPFGLRRSHFASVDKVLMG